MKIYKKVNMFEPNYIVNYNYKTLKCDNGKVEDSNQVKNLYFIVDKIDSIYFTNCTNTIFFEFIHL